jgi:hypothetical protein
MRPQHLRGIVLLILISVVLLVWSFSAIWQNRDYPQDGLWGLGRPLANLWLSGCLIGAAIISFSYRRNRPLWVRLSACVGLLLFATMLVLDNLPRVLLNMQLTFPQHGQLEALKIWCLFGGLALVGLVLVHRMYGSVRSQASGSTDHPSSQ